MKSRHGRDDVTIVSQEEMLTTLGDMIDVLTMGLCALGGIPYWSAVSAPSPS